MTTLASAVLQPSFAPARSRWPGVRRAAAGARGGAGDELSRIRGDGSSGASVGPAVSPGWNTPRPSRPGFWWWFAAAWM